MDPSITPLESSSNENSAVRPRGSKRLSQSSPSVVALKKPCPYGTACYRKNPIHFQEFDHPGANSSASSSAQQAHENDINSTQSNNTRSATATGPETSGEFYGFYLFRVRGLNYGRMHTITLSDLLNPSNGDLIASAQFNYMFDVDWLVSQYPKSSRNAPLLIVHGFQGAEKQALDAACSKYPNIERCQAHIRLPYGTHHTKMMLFQYRHGLQIVIHTANMINDDWHLRTQGIWRSPLLPSTDESPNSCDSPTGFRADLIRYLKSYGSTATQTSTSALARWIEILNRYDFRPIRVFLVASTSGRFTGQEMSHFGHLRLRELLRLHSHEVPSSWPVIGQFSSIGSLGAQPTNWLTTEWSTSMAGRGARGIKLIYPCVDDVRNSLEGYAAGGCLPYSQRTAEKQPWLRQFLHRWLAGTHTRAGPHIKTYARVSPDGSSAAWFLLTSANLSKAAWGAFEKDRTQLMMRSYELGVLFLPSQFEPESDVFQLDDGTTKSPRKDRGKPSNLPKEMRVTKHTFPIPYQLPPEPYGQADQPWIVDQVYSSPDIFGNVWKPR